jgi:hypothetical protein
MSFRRRPSAKHCLLRARAKTVGCRGGCANRLSLTGPWQKASTRFETPRMAVPSSTSRHFVSRLKHVIHFRETHQKARVRGAHPSPGVVSGARAGHKHRLVRWQTEACYHRHREDHDGECHKLSPGVLSGVDAGQSHPRRVCSPNPDGNGPAGSLQRPAKSPPLRIALASDGEIRKAASFGFRS